MKAVLKTMIFVLLVITAAEAQQKVVSFRKIKEFLPNIELQGFERRKPEGNTQTVMGMSTSEATVRYTSKDTTGNENIQSVEINIKIADMSAIPGAALAFSYMQDYEKETENGYEKSTTVNKVYKGREKVNSGDSKSCEVEFAVGQRFFVTISMHGSDNIKMIYKLIDSIKLADLEKLTPEDK